jgi:predicted ATPase/class 3 adenylate cyclase
MTWTFLFTDIEGSTRQWEESPGMHERVEQHFTALRVAVEGLGGEVFATMGDGIAAAFTSVDAAVQAAVSAQRLMPLIGLEVRMGIHTGEAERVGDDFRGRPVNRAARIAAVGHGGQILVSDVAAALVRSAPGGRVVDLLDLGTHRLRDLTEPERIWQVRHPDLSQDFPPVRGLDACSNNLPAQRSSLVGRDHDVARVVTLVRDHRIVTLTGVGGVGKTRLAVQSAADLLAEISSVWFVELASVADPDDVADAIALTMGLGAVPDALEGLVAMLSSEVTLLVVDNCEHLVDSAASVIDRLTAACPDLSVIATSREALGVDGEHVVAVRTLDPPTAVELFQQRAAAAGADLSATPPAMIEHLCRRLDGIPLAIELAAARAVTLGVPAIVSALDDRFSLLSGGRRRAVDRHSTMRGTIDWSYRLLESGEQKVLRWLAVFPNGFELDAVRHVAGGMGIDAPAASEHVASLVHKSMVAPEAQAHGVRYRMLETVRAFALEQLDEPDERLAALTAHAQWVTTLTDLPFDDPCNAAVERSAIRLEREADSWRDAVLLAARQGSGDLAARLCGPPVAFFLLGRHDLADLVVPLLAHCGSDPRRRRAVLCALTVSSSGATVPADLLAWADEMEQIEELEPTGLGGLMRWLALAWQGDFAASVEVCVAASLDPRIRRATHDLFVGIAALDHFSLTDATNDPHGLVERALEVAGRSDVALSRVTCLLGAAWGLAGHEPGRSLALVRRALADIDDVPALTRLTLPGSASRLLTRLDPRVAAEGLLEQLAPVSSRRSFVDLIPVFYAAALLHGLGHPAGGSAWATLTVSPLVPYPSMMDFVELARRASATSSGVSLSELESLVRSGLSDVVAGGEEGSGNPLRDDRCLAGR